MLRLVTAALVMAPAIVQAQEAPVPISEVDVTVELEAVDSNALDRWPEIGPDLAAAITATAAPFVGEGGRIVDVVVNEMSNGGTAVLGDSGEFNRLGGWVYVREEAGAPPIFSEEIELEADTFVPGGTAMVYTVPGRPEFYNALVNVFALRVVEEVQTAD